MKKKKEPLILLDVGNTAITYARYEGARMNAPKACLHKDIPKLAKIWSKCGKSNPENLIISSVVPKITQMILKTAKRSRGLKTWVAGRNLKVPIRSNYRPLNKLGIDRQVNLYGALHIYRPPFLIVDFGTAITMDYVDKRGVFRGGMILPGPQIAFQTLLERAALIPKSLRLPTSRGSFLGHNTYDCMRSGILEGYSAMTEGLIEKFRSRYGARLRVIATGGFAKTIQAHTRALNVVDPALTLKGLWLLYRKRPPTNPLD